MKSLISLQMQNGNNSLVMFEHDGWNLATVCTLFEAVPQVAKATVLVGNITGSVLAMNAASDSIRSVAEMAAL